MAVGFAPLVVTISCNSCMFPSSESRPVRILRRVVSLAAVVVIAAIAVVGVPSAAVAAPPWTPPVDVSAAGGSAFAPQIVVTGTNALSAIWYRSNGTNNIVQSSASADNGATWSTPVDVSATGGSAFAPQIVVTGTNTLSAIWYRSNGTNLIVQSSLSTNNGATWSTPVNVSAALGDAVDPQLVVTGANALSAIWYRFNGTNLIVQSSASADNGATWSAPVDVSVTGGDAFAPQLVVTGTNALSAIWYRFNGTNNIVQSSLSADSGATWSTPVDVSTTGGDAAFPQIVVTGTNALSAIWYRNNGTNNIVQSSLSADNGANWSTPVNVSTTGGNAIAPQLVVTGTNALSAIWYRSNGTNTIVQTSTLLAPVVTPPELAATGTNGASAATGIFTVAGLTLLGTVLLLTSRRRTARTARTSGFSGKALSSK